MNDTRNSRQRWSLCNDVGCGSSPFLLSFSASVRGRTSQARCIVLTAISTSVFKFISTSYVTVLVRANEAKEK